MRRSAIARCNDQLEDLARQAVQLRRLLDRPDVDCAIIVGCAIQIQRACECLDVAGVNLAARRLRRQSPQLFDPRGLDLEHTWETAP